MKKMNSKYRRLLSRLPEEMKEVLHELSLNYEVISYSSGGSGPGWATDIKTQNQIFRISSEYMCLAVERITDGQYESIEIPEPELGSITPSTIAKAIREEISYRDRTPHY